MPKPTNNTADIYTADLMFEDHGKCFTTKVLTEAESFELDPANMVGVWKIMCLGIEGGTTSFTSLACDNISGADCTKLCSTTFNPRTELMGNVFTEISVNTGMVILYMDCQNS